MYIQYLSWHSEAILLWKYKNGCCPLIIKESSGCNLTCDSSALAERVPQPTQPPLSVRGALLPGSHLHQNARKLNSRGDVELMHMKSQPSISASFASPKYCIFDVCVWKIILIYTWTHRVQTRAVQGQLYMCTLCAVVSSCNLLHYVLRMETLGPHFMSLTGSWKLWL